MMNGIKPTAERAMKSVYKGASGPIKRQKTEGSVGCHMGEESNYLLRSGSLWPVLSLWCLGQVEEKADGQKELERVQELW